MALLRTDVIGGNKLNCFKATQVLGGPTHILIWGSEIAKSWSLSKLHCWFCDTLMIFLIMFSVILLSMLMILLSAVMVIRHLISDSNKNSLLNLDLTHKTLYVGTENGLFISILEKLKLKLLFDWSNNSGDINVKMESLLWKKNDPLICWDCVSLLNWIGALPLCILLKQPSRKMEPWFLVHPLF